MEVRQSEGKKKIELLNEDDCFSTKIWVARKKKRSKISIMTAYFGFL